jgi:hypothetical protein
MTAYFSYLLAVGTISKATLQGNVNNNIENFPIQADQFNPGLAWREPSRDLTQRPKPSRLTMMADSATIRADGNWTFALGWKHLTIGQFQYLLTTFLPSGVFGAPVTVQVAADEAATFYMAFNAIIRRPIPEDTYKSRDGEISDCIFKFDSNGGPL